MITTFTGSYEWVKKSYFPPSSRFAVWLLKVLLFLSADGDGKLYDAYVVYPRVQGDTLSEAVEAFAVKTLPQVLEGCYGYRLFILGRDSLPGQGKMVYSKLMYEIEMNISDKITIPFFEGIIQILFKY